MDVSYKLSVLDVFETWGGDTAQAARTSIAVTRQDLDGHGREVMKVALAAEASADQIEAVQADLRGVIAEAQGKGLVVDEVNSTVTASPTSRLPLVDQSLAAGYQLRVNAALTRADQIDDSLAAAINYADGDSSAFPVIPGNGTDLLVRIENQSAAFEEVFGRLPASVADWQTAAALDPHSYLPKNDGVPPNIVVGTIEPVPGQGVVEVNLFIASEEVVYPTPDGGWDYNYGDNRGFNPNLTPEHNRVTILIDYENGLIVTRQNPSVRTSDGASMAGTPLVSATQSGADGSVFVEYDTVDPFVPGGERVAQALPWVVNGQIVISPGTSGPAVGGVISAYPAVEVYGTSPTGATSTLVQDMPRIHDLPLNLNVLIPETLGPLTSLPFQQGIGDTSLLDPFYDTRFGVHSQQVTVPPVTTPLGPASAPVTIGIHE
ncbi:MAG: hypothetical protein ACSLE6_09875 [Mycobacterium sp.]